MKKTTPVLAAVLALNAEAIVFIPPVVYLVTFSVGAFVVNIFLLLAAWLAISGLMDRSYFGKKSHELVRAGLQTAGKATISLASAAVPVLGLNPITSPEVFVSSLAAGAIGLCILFLSGYREYRLMGKKQRGRVLKSIAAFSTFIILATYLSTTLALETRIIDTRTGQEVQGAVAFDSIAYQKEATDQKEPAKGVYWFYPADPSPCKIYLEGVHFLTFQPTKNCYYLRDGKPERIYCPMPLDATEFRGRTEAGVIEGKGSCNQTYPLKD
jgi:hypothetical protein